MEVVKNLILKQDVDLLNNKLTKQLLIMIEKNFKKGLLNLQVELQLLKLVVQQKLKLKREKTELKML